METENKYIIIDADIVADVARNPHIEDEEYVNFQYYSDGEYPRKLIDNGECVGLEVYCIGILMDDMVGKLKELLPGFNIQKIPNEEYISIKIK